MTLPEVLLWQQLRQRPGGFKFRRQHMVDPYVVDFFCGEARLVIEVDGAAHDGVGAERDAHRDARLRERGLSVFRVSADEVLGDAGAVVMGILARVEGPLHQASPGPPTRSGEDFE
jgi:very-short-patch-repair endonuclease